MERPSDPECRRCTARDVQVDPQENTCHKAIATNGSLGQLRPRFERILLRPSPRCFCTGVELLSDRETSLPDGRLWTAVRGGARLLGLGL